MLTMFDFITTYILTFWFINMWIVFVKYLNLIVIFWQRVMYKQMHQASGRRWKHVNIIKIHRSNDCLPPLYHLTCRTSSDQATFRLCASITLDYLRTNNVCLGIWMYISEMMSSINCSIRRRLLHKGVRTTLDGIDKWTQCRWL